MRSNKALGNMFEMEFAETLYRNGWWVHNAVQGKAGQPADIIACKGVVSMLIDCKVCSNDTFDINRIEPNQETAMKLWNKRVNRLTFFALKMSDGRVYIAEFESLLNAPKKVLTSKDIEQFEPLDVWLKGVGVWS